MRFSFISAFALIFATIGPSTAQEGPGAGPAIDDPTFAAARSSPRIVGGQDVAATDEDWRFMASIDFGGDHWCGGAYLLPRFENGAVDRWEQLPGRNRSPRLLLTAAHCLYDHFGHRINEEDLRVIGGNVDRNPDAAVVQPVLKAIAHPDYNDSLDNDIAVLILGAPEGEANVALAALALPDLPTGLQFQRTNAALDVLGWGATAENSTETPTLQRVRLPYADQAQCRDLYRRVGFSVNDSAFCAGFSTGGYDSCQGDSGGPAVFHATNAKGARFGPTYVVGVVSWGQGCARHGLQGVYTDVLQARWWLDEIARIHRTTLTGN